MANKNNIPYAIVVLTALMAWRLLSEISQAVKSAGWAWAVLLVAAALALSIIRSRYVDIIKFNDDGIIIRSELVPWGEITALERKHGEFCFGYHTGNGDKSYLIWYRQTNYLECLERAVEKLPPDIFTEAARESLIKMGIWGDEPVFDVNSDKQSGVFTEETRESQKPI